MSYLITEVTRTDGAGIESPILDWERITIRKGLDQKANTVNVVLSNSYNRTPVTSVHPHHRWVDDNGELIWQENDAISVKCKQTQVKTTLTDSDLLMLADALEFNGKLESNRTTLSVKGVDKTFALLNQQIPRAFTLSDEKRAPEIIQAIIQQATFSTDGSGLFEVDATLQAEATYVLQKDAVVKGIQTRRTNNSLFPIIPMGKVYKPVYEWIDDLSTIEATNNFDGRDTTASYTSSGGGVDNADNPTQKRKMKYFVDKDNVFRWFYPDNDVDYYITIGDVTSDEDNVKSYNLTKSTFDVVNFVIYNGGQDLYGAGTLSYFFDVNTKSKKLLTKFKSYIQESVALIQTEINEGHLVLNSSGTFTFQGNRYNASGYPLTPEWALEAVANDGEYNDALRNQIDKQCKQKASSLTNQRSSPRWKGDVTIEGRNFLAGELIELTSYVHGISTQPLRILDMTHNITKSGWTTTLNLEEDEAEMGTVLS